MSAADRENVTPSVVYIQADDHIQVDQSQVCIGDVADVYCKDEAFGHEIEQIPLMTVDLSDSKKNVVSLMTVISKIDAAASRPVLVQNIGASDFIISVKEPKQKGLWPWTKVLFVVFVTFIGSIFAIMTYNEDVDVSGVFDKLYGIMTGSQRLAPGILEGAYAVGVALGIIVFFNHFGKRKLTKDPTPMEIEMEKYESDIDDTLIKEAARKDEEIKETGG